MKVNELFYSRLLLVFYLIIFIWSAIHPNDYSIWLFEICGAAFLILVYLFFHQKIIFTKTTNTWFFVALSLITIGAHYSFPNVPLFDNFDGIFGMDRNNFDKLGHLVQGILPVLLSWEILVKLNVLKDFKWLMFLSFCIAIAVSGIYELIEWLFIIIFGNNEFSYSVLGSQGYIWDAQTDILCAMIGAIFTMTLGYGHLKSLLQYQEIK